MSTNNTNYPLILTHGGKMSNKDMSTEQLLQEGYQLKNKINEMTTRLRIINQTVANDTVFETGKKTSMLVAGKIKCKVTLKENQKWDQGKLIQLKDHFEIFDSIFKPEYKPKSSKVLQAAMNNKEFAQAVNWARTITPGAPSVTYEFIEDEVA